MAFAGSKPSRFPRMYLAVLRIFRYMSLSCLNMASEQRISTRKSAEAAHRRSRSAPYLGMISSGETPLPRDLCMARPSPSTVQPWVRTAL